MLGRFALSSLIVLISLRAIDNGLNMITLKTVKSILWILSGIGFFLSSYFIRKKNNCKRGYYNKNINCNFITASIYISKYYFCNYFIRWSIKSF